MCCSYVVRNGWTLGACLLGLLILAAPGRAQELADDMVGQSQEAWTLWQGVLRAVETDQRDEAGKILDSLEFLNLSALRLALMADRTGFSPLEQWAASDGAPANAKTMIEKIKAGKRQRDLAEDGWHFAAIGRFEYADANFKALLSSSPDPVALLELARANPNRHLILIKLLANTEVGPSAKQFLQVLNRGEEVLRTDPSEIVANIKKLGGPPRMVYNATNRLKDSGEHAVPHLIQFLQDGDFRALHAAIIQVLPQVGRGALNPLCIALGMEDNVTRKILVDAAGQIGYRQALPYLARLSADPGASGEVRAAAQAAIAALGHASSSDVSTLFLQLAEDYYGNIDSLRADPRKDTANVWYLRGNELRLVEVPAEIFNDIMAMRCCEEALKAKPGNTEATALWLAANFRREAKLGLDVESDEPDPRTVDDATRPEDTPRAIYFARAAGPMYNHRVLARAYRDRDVGVALGAIAALSQTAGEGSLVGGENAKQSLVQCLAFPNRQVRIKAALALARALPKRDFTGSHNVVPVLAEALAQAGRQAALIVDPDANSANRFQAVLRAAGYDCAVGANLNRAKDTGRKAHLSSYDVVLLASDIERPDVGAAVGDLRRDPNTAMAPILILTKEGQTTLASNLARRSSGVEVLLSNVADLGDPEAINQQVTNRISRAAQALGMGPLEADLSLRLALDAADALRDIAESHSSVFDFNRAVPALLTALGHGSEALRIKSAHVLALAASGEAQTAIAEAALDDARSTVERLAAFGALAESARRNGNLLGTGEAVGKLIQFVMSEKDLVLRAAGSKALGALDLPSNKASEIIRAQHRG